ncbi:MAG: YjbQ family protein, partial [Candidatus Geothermarchaeales archaeon]
MGLTAYEEAFTFETRGEFDHNDITQEVSRVVTASGVKKGMALVFGGHATGVIAITEYESMLLRDIQTLL